LVTIWKTTCDKFRAMLWECPAAGAVLKGSLLMHREFTIVSGLLIGLNLMCSTASAQWGYPRGYGMYGMSQSGADPASGYMAGLGSYARGQGVYQQDKAKADAINADTMIKWNKALRARQQALREENRKKAIKDEAAREVRVERIELRDGTTLNNLLLQILDADPGVVQSGRAKNVISVSAIREIPFEWDSEAITFCIDQMTANDALPQVLMRSAYVDERNAVHSAVQTALDEDAKGTVSSATTKRIAEAVSNFRAKFLKTSSDFEVGYNDALEYFTVMASLSRLLNDPSMQAFLKQLDTGQERTVGDLIVFMNSHNLRFWAATTDHQISIYEGLVPVLTAIRDVPPSQITASSTPDRTGKGLISAAKDAFKSMGWEQLEAHLRSLWHFCDIASTRPSGRTLRR
jgi:hypothetical protein